MDHEQKRREQHEHERKEKQAHERQSEERFSKSGAMIRPLWFLVLGIVLTMIALFIWWRFYLP
jgi:type VI protein secretion system component VasF